MATSETPHDWYTVLRVEDDRDGAWWTEAEAAVKPARVRRAFDALMYGDSATQTLAFEEFFSWAESFPSWHGNITAYVNLRN